MHVLQGSGLAACSLCGSRHFYYAFSHRDFRVVRCGACALLFLNPQPGDHELAGMYGDAASPGVAVLHDLERYRGSREGRLLEIGCGRGDLLLEARRLGYDVSGLEASPSATARASDRLGGSRVRHGVIETSTFDAGSFDVCVLSNVIEHLRDPVAGLGIVHRLLKPGGTLVITSPSAGTASARLLRQNRMEFKTIHNLLFRAGFHKSIAQSAPLAAGGITVFARTTTVPERRTLSVIVPAFNERPTFDAMMAALVEKTLPDLDIEIIVVESNSADGTREAAMRYRDHPRVRIVLEDRPRGKGHAVRAGLREATGDFVLIQDADLEYDLEDYDALVEPLLRGREAFVLGSRHGGSAWKMRRFTNQRVLSAGLNVGHWFFTTLVNVLFGLRLRDPFTMFKVFRRDCLYGLTFECNRFDFDYELLIKLVRKGYRPIEIPVNYRSRSFHEGKKVSMWRDPVTWLRVLVRLRLARVDPLREIAKRGERD